MPASVARRLGSYLLTETMERRPEIGLDSYDRFFPNQDTLPRGGFGNLIAMPLQKRPRDVGNSVFVDDEFAPHADQWALLSSIERMSPATVEELVSKAAVSGRIIDVRIADDTGPWGMPPSRRHAAPRRIENLPAKLELILADQIYIPKNDLSPALRNRLTRLAAFQNPEFYKAQSMRLPTPGKPRIISCAEDHAQHLSLPRGCIEDVHGLLDDLHIDIDTRDERTVGEPINLKFHGDLRPGQNTAVRKLLAHDIGVLSATTAFGKTVVAAWMIAQRGVNTLVLVHRRQLLDQWITRLSEFLGICSKQIGQLGGGRRKLARQVDVAMIQSLVRKGAVNDCVADYGQVIVDECHHLSAHSFETVARAAKARYFLGLTATVARKDGHHPIIFMQCGPVRHSVDAKAEACARPF